MSQVFTEGRHAAEFVMAEANGNRSRENGTIGASQDVKPGTVLGANKAKGLEAASAAKAGGNTGNGTLVLDATTPLLRLASLGVYKLRFTTTTSMRLEDPDGHVLGDIAIGGTTGNNAAVAEQIKGVVTQGATPFAAGDGFDVTVTESDEGGVIEFGALNPAAADGMQDAAALALYPAKTGVGESVQIAIIARDCTVNGKCLEWPDGITDAQKAAAVAQLADRGIIVR